MILYILIQCFLERQKATSIWNVKIQNSRLQGNHNRSEWLLLMTQCDQINAALAAPSCLWHDHLRRLLSERANTGFSWQLLAQYLSVSERLPLLVCVLHHANSFLEQIIALSFQIIFGMSDFFIISPFYLFTSIQYNSHSSTLAQRSCPAV